MHVPQAEKAHLPGQEAPKILVIDDERLIHKAMEMALRHEGYKLYYADNGEQGLKILREESPELIFLDLEMPVMNGYQFLQAAQVTPDSPFALVVITGHGDNLEIRRCYRMGIDFFLRKPLNLVEVCGLARRCIELKRMQKERCRLLVALQESQEKLEERVKERTAALSDTVTSLEQEIREHAVTTEKLEKKTRALLESNIALQVLLKNRDDEKARYDMELIGRIEKMIQPYLDRLKESKPNGVQKNIFELLEQNVKAITSPFLYSQMPLFMKLTAKEIQVANLIKQGMSTKEIAAALDVSTRTVETHRYQIRRKVGLQGKKKSLRQELQRTF